MTVRERLDALTAKLWTSVDQALDTTTPTPAADSIAASKAAIDAAVTDLAAITGATTVADLNAQITAITAIAANQRTQAQKDMLVLLRIVKAQDAAIVALYRASLDNRRRARRCSGRSPSLPGSPCSSMAARHGCGPATWTATSDDRVAGRHLPGDLVRRGHRRRDGAVVLQPGIGAVGPRIGPTGRAMMSAVTPARGIRETRTG